MKKIVLIWCWCFSLSFAGTPFTLSEIDELYVVVENNTKLVDQKTEAKLKAMMLTNLQELGVKTENYPSESLVLMISQNSFGNMKFLNAKMMVISQVKRAKAKESTLGIIYMIDDLFDTTEPNEDMVESLEYMLSEFSDQFKEDSSQ